MRRVVLISVLSSVLPGCSLLLDGGGSAGSGSDGPGEEALVAVYHFDELATIGGRPGVSDRSGHEPPLDLVVAVGDANPVFNSDTAGTYLDISDDDPIRLVTPDVPQRLITACQESGELTVEAWVRPDDSVSDNARIVVLGEDLLYQVFMLGQTDDQLDLRFDTEGPGSFVGPAIEAFEVHHLALVARATDSIEGWIDGERVIASSIESSFTRWETEASLRLAVANDPAGGRPFLGRVYHAQVWCAALGAEVLQDRDRFDPPD